jgi:hypothetical protein
MGEGGRLAEISIILVLFTFIGTFVTLVSLNPFGASSTMSGVNTPTYYASADIILYNSTVYSVNFTKAYEEYPYIGKGFWFAEIYLTPGVGANRINIYACNSTNWRGYEPQFYAYLVYSDAPGDFDPLNWVYDGDSYGNVLYDSTLDDIGYNTGNLTFDLTLNQFARTIIFNWNATAYPYPSDACDADSMTLIYGATWDQLQTKINAWTIFAQIVTFQYPDIFWAINLLLAVPFWVCVGYLIMVIVRSLIPLL